MIENIKKGFTKIVNVTPTFLSIIATIAIIWYLATAYNVANNWWFLPLFAGIIGISALTHPWLCKRHNIFYSWTATGCAILVLNTLKLLVGINFATITLVLFTIAFVTDLSVHGTKVFHFGEIIFDIIVSALTAFIMLKITFSPIWVITLIIEYAIIIMLDLNDPIIVLKAPKKESSKE